MYDPFQDHPDRIQNLTAWIWNEPCLTYVNGTITLKKVKHSSGPLILIFGRHITKKVATNLNEQLLSLQGLGIIAAYHE